MTGLFLGLGFVVASFFLWKQARKIGYNEEKVIDGMLITAMGSFLGARIGYIIFDFARMGGDLGKWLLFTKYPGWSQIGAVASGILILIILGKTGFFGRKGSWEVMDLFAVPTAVFMAAGYFGTPILPGLLVFSGYFLLIIFLSYLQRRILRNPDAARFLDKPGFMALGVLLWVFVSNVLLAKTSGGVLYYLWIGALALTGATFLIRYKKLTIKMIKFPASVLTQIQKYLENKKAQTEHRLADLKKEDPFEDKNRLLDNATDDAEANQKAGHERTQALMAQLNLISIETRKALTKIKIGNYGICEKCGKMIDTDRLAAIPTATLCLSCEKKKEK